RPARPARRRRTGRHRRGGARPHRDARARPARPRRTGRTRRRGHDTHRRKRARTTMSTTAQGAGAPAPTEEHPGLLDALKGQPKQVWVTAFAAVIAFMGIGLVDPILNTITEALDATPSQTTLLFASYLGVQVFAMLLTGVLSYRFGAKRTVVTGLILIVVAAGVCAAAQTIEQLVWLRALWGLGNAFFIATALTVIVGAAAGGQKGAILLYEAALGLGLSVGPLLGA